jgi:hypothetical protein
VIDGKKGDFKSADAKRLESVFYGSMEFHESKYGSAIGDDPRTSEYMGQILHPIKFTKTHEMVIMTVTPDDTIDSGRPGQEQLLAEIGSGLNEDLFIFIFDEERGSQPLGTC